MVLSSTMIYSRESVKRSVTKAKPGSPLLVPSAEILYLRGATNLENLIEFIPLAKGPRPQPGLAVGLKSSAFTSEQLKKLQFFIGDWKTTSRLVTRDEMYFPLLTAEVKCGNEALNIADRQNAHSAAVAANAVVESRQDELNQNILTFSISHDNEAVRMYGHYALIKGKHTQFYRHPIKKFEGPDSLLTETLSKRLSLITPCKICMLLKSCSAWRYHGKISIKITTCRLFLCNQSSDGD